jgi:hypothetical protein
MKSSTLDRFGLVLLVLLAGLSAKAADVKKGDDGELITEAKNAKVQPIVIVRPQDVDEKSMSGQYHFYLGTTHAHSGYSGDHQKTIAEKLNKGAANYSLHTPAEIFEKAKKYDYDFYFMTDHSSPEQNEFYKGGFTDEHWAATHQMAAAATTDKFLAMVGFEFSRNNDPDKGGLGHMNVLGTKDWESAYAKGHTFEWAYDWLAAQKAEPVAAQFNHPAMPGTRAKNFSDFKWRTKERNDVVCLAEIWNSGEGMGYVPVVKKIWAMGWKVAPTCGTDVHGPLGVENRHIRTGVLAERLDAASVMAALRARRAYATLEPKLHLEFTLNGAEMGTAMKERPAGELKAKVFVNDPAGAVISRVEIYGAKYDKNGGGTATLAKVPVGSGKKLVEAAVGGGFDFYYVAVFKEGVETPRAFGAPVWMDDE